MKDCFLYSGLRSPFGRHGGALSGLRVDDMAAQLVDRLVSDELSSHIDDVIIGNSNQAGEDSRNLARNVVLRSKLPKTVPGITVNRLCASGLSAIVDGARSIKSGEHSVVLAGGAENMSRAPYVLSKTSTAFGRDAKLFDTTMGARFANSKVLKEYGSESMPETADNICKDLGISREDSDAFAFRSQQKFEEARKRGFLGGELCQINLPPRKRVKPEDLIVTDDEHPRPNTTLEKLQLLRPLFDGGVVSSGNASGINDGSAVVLLGDQQAADKIGLEPLARVVASSAVGVEPRTMGLGPVPAIQKLLTNSGLSLNDIDVIEINEAFASQVLGCLMQLDISQTDSRVNPNGGAIAVGHPLGASGARLALTAARQLKQSGGKYALVSLCVGMGQGVALLLEN